MSVTLSYLRHLAIPFCIALAGFALADYLKNFAPNVLFVFAYLPYFFFGVSALLCVQFNQSRMLFSLLNIFLVYLILHSLQFSILRLYEFVLFFWAFTNIAVLAQLPERSVLSVHSLVRLALLGVQVLLTWYLLVYQFLIAESILYNTGFPPPPESINFSWLLIITSSLALLATSIRFIFQPGPILAAHLIFIFILVGLLGALTPQTMVIALGLSAAIIVFLAVLFDSHNMAYRDELTGLRSRRALNQYLTGLGRKYTIAMMDIDHFKKFNDNHGHDVGDQMLKLVSSRIARVGGGGTPFRYGGEEFTVVFPRKSIEDVEEHLEALRESIEGYPLIVRAKDRPKQKPDKKKKAKDQPETLSCTISIGISNRGEDRKSPEQVVKGADEALYRAKEKGRNCLSL